MDNVRLLIRSFFQHMTEEQQTLLKEGAADTATKVMMAKLLLDVIAQLSESISPADGAVVSKDFVLSSLGDTLPKTVAMFLNVDVQVNCDSSKSLTDLIAAEVAKKVNMSSDTWGEFSERCLSPEADTLTEMISHASHMMRDLHTPPSQRSASARASLPQTNQHQDTSDQQGTTMKPSAGSMDSSVSATTRLAEQVIRRELSDITKPLLDNLVNPMHDLLQAETTKDVAVIAADIVKTLDKEVKSLKETDTTATDITKLSSTGVDTKLKSFFAKQFAKLSIHKMVKELETEFHNDNMIESEESLKTLIHDVDSLLHPEGDQQQDDETLVRLGDISKGKDLEFAQKLCEIFFSHLTPEITLGPNGGTIHVLPPPDTMHKKIKSKVWIFLRLMGWWLSTQADVHCGRVTKALKDSKSVSPTPTDSQKSAKHPADPGSGHGGSSSSSEAQTSSSLSEEQTNRKQRSVRTIMEKLVSRLFKKAKLIDKFGKSAIAIVNSLNDRIWSEIQHEEFHLTTDRLKKLDKIIFKDLCEKWMSAEAVLISLTLHNEGMDNNIVSIIREHLMKPKKQKRNCFLEFFCCLYRVMSKPYSEPFV